MNKNIEYINHKPNMSIDFFCKNCINCKYREIGGSFDMNTVSGRCSYPYKGKCSKRTISYKFGQLLAYFLLILGLLGMCVLMYKIGFYTLRWLF